MSNYYFVATALPPLQVGVPPEISFEALIDLLKTNLSSQDYNQVKVIRRYYDINNIRSFWLGWPLEEYGNFDSFQLEEALIGREGFPNYVYDFLDQYDRQEDRLAHFPELVLAYFKQEEARASGFLRRYLAFEREWRLVMLGFRAKALGRDLATELQFEDPNDDMVAQILAQKDAKIYIPPDGYQELQPIFEEFADKPLELHQALIEFRFAVIKEMVGISMFSIERILGYLIRLIMVEQWFKLDRQKGLEITDKILK